MEKHSEGAGVRRGETPVLFRMRASFGGRIVCNVNDNSRPLKKHSEGAGVRRGEMPVLFRARASSGGRIVYRGDDNSRPLKIRQEACLRISGVTASMRVHSRSPHRIFTLIELLVVIAIIALLAAMLLPALNGARERGRSILCGSNMRQVNTALLQYGDDNGDWMPYSTTLYWQQALVEYGYFSVPVLSSGVLNNVSPSGILQCPSEPRLNDGVKTNWNTWKGSHYGINEYQLWNGSFADRWGKFSKIPQPSRICQLGEKSITVGSDSRFTGAANALDHFKHSPSSLNAAFFDNHVEMRTRADVPHAEIDANYNQRVFWGYTYYASSW